MENKKVKDYFSKNNTVYLWWNPHEDDKKEVYKRQEKIIKKIIKSRKLTKILDVSSGKGRYAKLLSNGRDYTCLDISREMLNHIKRLNLNVKLIKGDAEKIPFKDKFECIICAESLVHYPNPKKALREMKRVLENEGILILTVDNKYCLGKLIRICEDFFRGLFKKPKKGIGNNIYTPYTDKEYKEMFVKSKLKLITKINLSIFTTPIKIYSTNSYLIRPNFCNKFLFLDKVLEKIPIINKLSTYYIYVLKNE